VLHLIHEIWRKIYTVNFNEHKIGKWLKVILKNVSWKRIHEFLRFFQGNLTYGKSKTSYKNDEM